ncbi:hypothetical protein [Brevibacillus centrosporus]|uniref:hypothetical protein n=1 Tax=Brevibacillus centrosporus TaxID=54910 RepID=UPI003987EA3A
MDSWGEDSFLGLDHSSPFPLLQSEILLGERELHEVPLAGFLLFFARDWYRWLRHRILSKSSKMLIAILSIVFLLYGSFHTYQEFTTYKPMLLEKMEKKYSREISPELFEAMTSGINVYTNSLYFNYVTFLMFVALINLWVLVSQML